MTWDERLHWLGGWALGLAYRFFEDMDREAGYTQLNRWAWAREERQNQAGKNPNYPMSQHQIAEARAWGIGYRRGAGLEPLDVA